MYCNVQQASLIHNPKLPMACLLLRADRLRLGEAICGSASHLLLRWRPSTTKNSGAPPVPIVCGAPKLHAAASRHPDDRGTA